METCLMDADGNVGECMSLIHNRLLGQNCCRRAFIRGAFLAAGSVSDPEKSYHFEIVCNTQGEAEYLRNLISAFELDGKIVARKRNYVVYLKEGSQIVDILNVMEAHVALLEFENIRIMKDMRTGRTDPGSAVTVHITVNPGK